MSCFHKGEVSKKDYRSAGEISADGRRTLESLENCAMPPSGKRNPQVAFLLISVILFFSFTVYFNSLFNGFVFDDESQVVNNRWITDLKYIPDIFSHSAWGFLSGLGKINYYRPMMSLVYMINYHIFGLKPWGFHLVNILFHAGVSVLVFFLVLRLIDKVRVPAPHSYLPPFVAGLLFAVDPIHTEAVTWVAGLPDVSFAFFYLLSFYLFIRATSSNFQFNVAYILSIVSFFIASLCKEPALTLPIILVSYDYAFARERPNFTVYLKKYIPYLIVAAVYFSLRFQALGGFAPAKRGGELSVYQFFINIFPLFVQYLKKLIFPADLNALYVFHPIASLFEMKGIVSLIISIVFVILTLISFKKNRTVFLGLLFIVVPLLPALYIPAIGRYAFAERYLYIPSFGFVLLLASLVNWAIMNKPATVNSLIAVSLVVAGLYSLGTVSRNTVWKDDYTLYADVIKKSPDDDMPYYNLGRAYERTRQFDKAIEMYSKAIALNPAYFEAYNNLADVFLMTGEYGRAEMLFNSGIALNPKSDRIYNNRGRLYLTIKQYDKAIEDFTKAIYMNPNDAGYYIYRGRAYSLEGRLENAIKDFTSAIDIRPDDPDAYAFRGLAYLYEGDRMDARLDFQKACDMGYNKACDALRSTMK